MSYSRPEHTFRANGGSVYLSKPRASGGRYQVAGLAVPFHTKTGDGDSRTCVFSPQSFTKTISERRPKLLAHHDPEQVLGLVTKAWASARGVEVEAVIVDTTQGRDTVKLIEAGALDGFSVGVDFIRKVEMNKPADLVTGEHKLDPKTALKVIDLLPFTYVLEARWVELSCVTFPAFTEARIAPGVESQLAALERAGYQLAMQRVLDAEAALLAMNGGTK